MSEKFNKIYQESIQNPEKFWQKASDDIFWFRKPSKILNKSNPPFYKWYEDGVTNTCYNALDIHIDNNNGDYLWQSDLPASGSALPLIYNNNNNERWIFVIATGGRVSNDRGDSLIAFKQLLK